MKDAFAFIDTRIQLLDHLHLPLRMVLPQYGRLALDDPGPTSSAWHETEHITFRHSTADGDPEAALYSLLKPYLPVWLVAEPVEFGGTNFTLRARIAGDTSTATARLHMAPEALTIPEARDYAGARLLHEVARLLVECAFLDGDRP